MAQYAYGGQGRTDLVDVVLTQSVIQCVMLAAEPSPQNFVFLCPLAISVGTSVQIWGQLRECVLSFHQVEPKDGIQFVRFGGSCQCLLSHREGPHVFFYLHSDSFF